MALSSRYYRVLYSLKATFHDFCRKSAEFIQVRATVVPLSLIMYYVEAGYTKWPITFKRQATALFFIKLARAICTQRYPGCNYFCITCFSCNRHIRNDEISRTGSFRFLFQRRKSLFSLSQAVVHKPETRKHRGRG